MSEGGSGGVSGGVSNHLHSSTKLIFNTLTFLRGLELLSQRSKLLLCLLLIESVEKDVNVAVGVHVVDLALAIRKE